MISKRTLLTILGLTPILSGCNTLSLFNALTPKDSARRVAHNVAFGDHPRQTYDLYAPKSATIESKLPVLVFFYGGGWHEGSKADYVWVGHALASLGYLVAIPDYRLVPEVVYPAFLNDNASAIKHIISHAKAFGGDSRRLGVMGHSAGAYAAVMMVLDTRYMGTPSAISVCVGISGPYDFYPFDVAESINAFGVWPRPEETQPVHYARQVSTHFLLMHSRADTIVGMKNARNLETKLKAAGTDVILKTYNGLSHQDMVAALSVPFRKKAPLLADIQAFLEHVPI